MLLNYLIKNCKHKYMKLMSGQPSIPCIVTSLNMRTKNSPYGHPI